MVRMGFGDCFLLAFRGDQGDPVYVLIDSGTHFQADDATERMRAAAEHVLEATGGHVHVLVGTHEHFDHLAGFNRGRNTWDTFQVDQTWLAWTEEPGNELADRLRQSLTGLADGVRHALIRWRGGLADAERSGALDAAASAAERRRIEGIGHILEFAADDDGDGHNGDPADVPRSSMAHAFRWMALKAGDAIRYLRPDDAPFTLPGASGVRVYVLGPPEDEELLLRSDPSPGPDSEVYDLSLAVSPAMAFLAAAEYGGTALDDLDEEDRRTLELSYPFEPHFRIQSDAEDLAEATDELARAYGSEGEAWRRIDHDWLGAAEELALKLDNDTNNTSLVLAFELIESGKVLLFVADAQVGNWLSWAEKRWDAVDDGGTAVEMTDLLRRTVLYKVGHHGSHNSTLRELGLERMTSDELAAMIPTDEDFADRMNWNIPFPPLLTRLKQKTRGRVMRADRSRAPRKPSHVSDAEWDRFKDASVFGRDYIDMTVE
jgi:beta-lactamase superfamily II metal-dependent hydrolase